LDGIVDSATLTGQVLQDEDTKRGKAWFIIENYA